MNSNPFTAKKDSGEENPQNHTVKFGETTPKAAPKDEGKEALRSQAEHAVTNMHGPNVKNAPNYKELIEDAEKQMTQAAESNKNM